MYSMDIFWVLVALGARTTLDSRDLCRHEELESEVGDSPGCLQCLKPAGGWHRSLVERLKQPSAGADRPCSRPFSK